MIIFCSCNHAVSYHFKPRSPQNCLVNSGISHKFRNGTVLPSSRRQNLHSKDSELRWSQLRGIKDIHSSIIAIIEGILLAAWNLNSMLLNVSLKSALCRLYSKNCIADHECYYYLLVITVYSTKLCITYMLT